MNFEGEIQKCKTKARGKAWEEPEKMVGNLTCVRGNEEEANGRLMFLVVSATKIGTGRLI